MKKIKIDEQNYKIEYKTTEKQRERMRIRHALHRDEDNARSRARYAAKKEQEKKEKQRQTEVSRKLSVDLFHSLFANYENAISSGDSAAAIAVKDMIDVAHSKFLLT